ncbi:unnamed protein product [Larinioides sclopetarius]|uniref:LAGLIDADG homing endonuclease n=1 Tax=Larinioides sclopetarius TaxID=280406 RepID=A0AAV1ZP81_9ARAC
MDLPSTPCLICYGEDATNAKAFKLYIDGTAAIEIIRNISDGFALMFASYYCFNIYNPKSASTTLEFVQRYLLGINPNRGSKKNPGLKKQEILNSKILNLVNKISEHELIDH